MERCKLTGDQYRAHAGDSPAEAHEPSFPKSHCSLDMVAEVEGRPTSISHEINVHYSMTGLLPEGSPRASISVISPPSGVAS